MTMGKTIGLTIWTFVSKVMSLNFNVLSRFVIVFLSRHNHLIISVILEPKNRKSVTAYTFYPSIYHEVMGLDVMILVVAVVFFFFFNIEL